MTAVLEKPQATSGNVLEFKPAEPVALTGSPGAKAELTIIIISYNTKALTLKCLETVFAQTRQARAHIVVLDNNSPDGSAEAIAEQFPQVELIASKDNLGFAGGNNLVAERARTEWLLLLNPDTEVHEGAIDALLEFARSHPRAGITGGRTVFPDGSLNPLSCLNRITPWSAFCMATGLTAIFRKSPVFNPENFGDWKRDTAREVDIVVGCFLMIPRRLWNELGGFDLKYFMYGEEADLCLRAGALGYQPMITPDAQIMHLVGAASSRPANKTAMVAKGRMTLIRDHWRKELVPFGVAMMWYWGAIRMAASRARALSGRQKDREAAERWRSVWQKRKDWLQGY